MKTNEFITYVEGNGGFNFSNLRRCYYQDKSKKSFRSWFIGYLIYSENLSKYVATKVANYYNV